MDGLSKLAGMLLAGVLVTTAAGVSAVETVPGVSQELAQARSELLANIHYQLRFVIPAQEQADIEARAVIAFDLTDSADALQLDFRGDSAAIHSVRSKGVPLDYTRSNEHIVLPASALRVGRNEIEIDFRAGAGSLNRKPDYLYSLFVPDRARTVFPLFDQPDLKARFELALVVPASWRAMSSAPISSVQSSGAQVEYLFEPSDLISSYLFSFVAGEFELVTREINGRTMTLFHRETDKAKVARNIDAVFELHVSSISWLEEYTGIKYPFRKFDFVLIPDFPYGGMEHVGAIQYRASLLLLDESPPVTELLNRAQLIAHETAHMWFGNLVTMRWFDDVWTKEVFANFMADKIVNPAFPTIDHELNFLLNHYPGAYAVDRSEGANPIRQALPNLNQAGQLYGSIIYHKAPIMMRQLELLTGAAGLRAGLRQYLLDFSYGNASWPGLVAILDTRTDRDLAAWSEVWVNSPGRPVFRLQSTPGIQGGNTLQLLQEDPAGTGRVWPQAFELLELYADDTRAVRLLAEGALAAIPDGRDDKVPLVRLYNADGRGYGLFPVDMTILQSWERLRSVQRGAALIGVYEQLLSGAPLGIEQYFELLQQIVQREEDTLLLELALSQLQFVYYSLLDGRLQNEYAPAMEDVLWSTMLLQPDSSRTRLLFRFFAGLASSPGAVQKLYDIWIGKVAIDKLLLEEDDRMDLAQTLAIRLPDKSAAIIERQLDETQNPDRRRRFEFITPSLAAEPAVRDAFFESLRDEHNRQTETWVSAALRNLHHPARLDQARKYVLPSLELLEEIQVTGDIFFPSAWLAATLANHHSPEVVQTVRNFLQQRPDYNPQLRMKILQAADPLFRASVLRATVF